MNTDTPVGRGGSFRLLRHVLSAYPGRGLAAFLFLFLAGLAEGLGLMPMLPLLGQAMDQSATADNRVAALLHGFLNAVGLSPTLGLLISLIVILVVTKNLLTMAGNRYAGYTSALVANMLRHRMVVAMMEAGWGYFTGKKAGALASVMGAESTWAGAAFRRACTVFADMLQVAVYCVLALLVSWKVTAGALVLGVVAVGALRWLVTMARRAGADAVGAVRAMTANLTDTLAAVKALKAMGLEKLMVPILTREADRLRRAEERQVLSKAVLPTLTEGMFALFLGLGLYGVLTLTATPFSEVLFLALLFLRTLQRVTALQRTYQELSALEPSFWSVNTALEEARQAAEFRGGGQAPTLEHALEMSEVDFAYGDKPVLKGVSLTIPAGRWTALLGPSGSGKTTLVDLLAGLMRPGSGQVLLDGVNLKKIDLGAWRSMIGYVPQDTVLLHDTVLANISLGDPEISREQVQAALQDAGAWDFVESLPQGMESVVGERGGRISGGQRQRLSLARALVRHPRLLILDEATTGLDPATEAAIFSNLKKLAGRLTILAISHQPSLKAQAEVIYRIEDGLVYQEN